MDIENPYYTVQVSAAGCGAEVRVNDVPIVRNLDPTGIDVELPASQFVFTGRNRLSILLTSLNDDNFENGRCEATLYVRPMGSDRAQRRALATVTFKGPTSETLNGFETTQTLPGLGALRIVRQGNRVLGEQVIPMATPFQPWLWLTADIIPNNQGTREDLSDVYRRFWEQLNANDVNGVRNSLAVNAAEISNAYYEQVEAGYRRLQVLQLMSDREIRLNQFAPAGMSLEIFGNGRLARIADPEGDGPIVFAENDGSLGYYVHMIYCKTPQYGWVKIR